MPVSPDDGAPPAGYDALRRAVVWGDAGPRGAIEVGGPDAVRFVDGFTTAAASRLAVGAGTEGFFPDARGWVLALANILRTENGLWIDVAADVAPMLLAHLDHYHIRERLELVDASTSRVTLVVAGPAAAAWLAERLDAPPPPRTLDHTRGRIGGVEVAVVRTDWYGTIGFRLHAAADHRERLAAWLAGQGLPRAAAAAFEVARIEAGSPEPADIPEKTLPQELGRDTRAIAFDKGCYLGQETVARIDALGHVNRKFVAVAVAGRDHPAAADVSADGQPVGRLTSTCRSPTLDRVIGIGLLQVKAIAAARPLTVAGVAAEVVPLPVVPRRADGGDDRRGGAAGPGDGHGLDPGVEPAVAAGELLLETKRFSVVRIAESCVDGGQRHREVVRHPGSVVVVPFVSSDEVCLVEVVRVAVGLTLLELPAGTLDRIESLEEAARRELAEETGYRAGRIAAAGAFWMSPGILRERMHLFVAEDLVPGPQALEPGEQIRTRVVAWETAVAMCLDGRIEDAKTVAAILLVEARRRNA
jgi:folate-binding protein YgfZ